MVVDNPSNMASVRAGFAPGTLTQWDYVDLLSAGTLSPQSSVNWRGSTLRRGHMFEGSNPTGSALSTCLIQISIVLHFK